MSDRKKRWTLVSGFAAICCAATVMMVGADLMDNGARTNVLDASSAPALKDPSMVMDVAQQTAAGTVDEPSQDQFNDEIATPVPTEETGDWTVTIEIAPHLLGDDPLHKPETDIDSEDIARERREAIHELSPGPVNVTGPRG